MIIGKYGRAVVNFFGIKLGVLIHGLRFKIAYKTLPRFANRPDNLFIDFPRRFRNPDRITIGNDVSFGPGTFLSATTEYPTSRMSNPEADFQPQTFNPRIVIGNRVSATADLQVAAVKEIVIEDDVMFASNVHINDSSHGYDNVDLPYKYQPLTNIAPICIKRGCWIGQNTIVLPGVTIGELSIVGANSVVTGDIPARCIAVGSPAKIIKRWNEKNQHWVVEAKPDNLPDPLNL